MQSACETNRVFSCSTAVRFCKRVIARTSLALTFGLGASCCALAANLLTDPGFESGIFNTGSFWNPIGEKQIWDCGEAHSGNCSLASSQSGAGGSNVTFQFVDTIAGQQYALSFFYKTNRNAFLSAPGDFEVISGDVGSFVTVLSGSVTSAPTWQATNGNFTATGPRSRVSFSGQGFEQNAVNFDDFVLSAIPEPDIHLMLLIGIAILVVVSARKSSRI
jgi:hypothetical protein